MDVDQRLEKAKKKKKKKKNAQKVIAKSPV